MYMMVVNYYNLLLTIPPKSSSILLIYALILSFPILYYGSSSPGHTPNWDGILTNIPARSNLTDHIPRLTTITTNVQTTTFSASSSPSSQVPRPSRRMHLTAIVTNTQNHSALQCWALTEALTISESTGTVGASTLTFGDFSNTVYTIMPPHFDGGLHNAPAAQVVVFLSGVANISLPTSADYTVVHGGREGIIFALDTVGSGHYTIFPSDVETVALQAPFKDGIVPAHEVVHEGPCRGQSIR